MLYYDEWDDGDVEIDFVLGKIWVVWEFCLIGVEVECKLGCVLCDWLMCGFGCIW